MYCYLRDPLKLLKDVECFVNDLCLKVCCVRLFLFNLKHMSHFSYMCKMGCPINIVLENWEYLY